MITTLDVLPVRSGGAAENMALDFLLLQRYPHPLTPRFRHYGWRRPAFTFGCGQKIAFVRGVLPADGPFDLCRRPTGGGVVDHRDDWTFALVIPRGHSLEDVRATQSYREVHECLTAALREQGVPARTKEVGVESIVPRVGDAAAADGAAGAAGSGAAAGVCFQRAELFDVVHERTGAKLAGAAQKRNKHGLLFQGSLWRPAIGAPLDEDRLHEDFTELLARALGGTRQPVPWPDLNEDEVAGLTEQYAAPEWINLR